MTDWWQFAYKSLFRTCAVLVLGFLPAFYRSFPAEAAADDQLIKRGEYLARAGDCVSCHTAPGGTSFAGGLYMPTPFGEISTPKITPDKATGIGAWSDDEPRNARRHRSAERISISCLPVSVVHKDHSRRRPRDQGLFVFTNLAPANAPRQPLKLAFPFSIRESLLAWRVAFFKPATFAPEPHSSDQLYRGAYLVEGLGHCGECHNRHNLFGASDWSGRLEGGEIEGWYAPNLTAAGNDSIEAWSSDQIATFLKSGAAPGKGVALGPMRETIDNSLRYLSDDDINAIAVYIKSAAANQSAKPATEIAPAPAYGGGVMYLSSCAFCHQPNGQGISGMIPALAEILQ
jgi:mono/diheme cytochrome c family protein